jgi:hypothetical protein
MIQDEVEPVPLCPNLSVSSRNMHQIWTDGKSIGQLVLVLPSGSPALPRSPLGEYSIGGLAKGGQHG